MKQITKFNFSKLLTLAMFLLVLFASGQQAKADVPNGDGDLLWERKLNGRTVNDAVFHPIKRKYTAVYPNPSEDKIIIPFDTVKPIINIILYDMLGRKITEEQYKNTDSIELNISNLAQSIYIIEIKTDNEIFEQQFIKK